jgi:hypothetical protein
LKLSRKKVLLKASLQKQKTFLGTNKRIGRGFLFSILIISAVEAAYILWWVAIFCQQMIIQHIIDKLQAC